MNKVEQFDRELTYIKEERIKEDAKYLISNLPDYFFEIPASSTGKYHPGYALGVGGLLRHTKAAVRMAHELLENPAIGRKYTSLEQDLIIVALLLHDGVKSGKEKSQYTKFEHPLLAVEMIKEQQEHLHFTKEELDLLCSMIASHMGVWNKDYNGNEVLPIPKTKYQNFVHMCDYLASRKFIKIEFDAQNNIVD